MNKFEARADIVDFHSTKDTYRWRVYDPSVLGYLILPISLAMHLYVVESSVAAWVANTPYLYILASVLVFGVRKVKRELGVSG